MGKLLAIKLGFHYSHQQFFHEKEGVSDDLKISINNVSVDDDPFHTSILPGNKHTRQSLDLNSTLGFSKSPNHTTEIMNNEVVGLITTDDETLRFLITFRLQ
uniref:Uncharacterized protein n=1 Tax=Rhizophagus irregularis (strain DAOM 181602 / DAOM 197198 / MUCL 43194) TaxID=747089 RepID=U9TXD4_RHIID